MISRISPVNFKGVSLNYNRTNNYQTLPEMQADSVCFTGKKEPLESKIVNRVLFEEDFIQNDSLKKCVYNVIQMPEFDKDDKEKKHAKLSILDKILSEEKLYKSPEFMDDVELVVAFSDTKEKTKAKSKMIDKILSDERLYNNRNFMDYATAIVQKTYNKDDVKAKSKMVDKILSDERLYESPEFMKDAGLIVEFTADKKEQRAKSKVIDKILSDEKLYNSQRYMNIVCPFICLVKTQEDVKSWE